MKFIHIADVHIGASLQLQDKNNTNDALADIINICNKNSIDLLLIAGDLFHYQPDRSMLDEVKYLFSKLRKTKVVIIAGNHDYITKDCECANYEWNDNVTWLIGDIEKAKVQKVYFDDIKTSVYGFSYNGKGKSVTKDRALYSEVRPDKKGGEFSILIGHGGDANNIPVNFYEIENNGFDYAAFGHIHKPAIISKCAAYSGSLIPMDRTETGAHGYISGNVSGGEVKLEFVPFAKVVYEDLFVALDASKTQYEIEDVILSEINNTDSIYNIILSGYRNAGYNIDTDHIKQRICLKAPQIKIASICDATTVPYNYNEIRERNSDNLLGKYINSVLAGNYDEDVRKYALEYGVAALENETYSLQGNWERADADRPHFYISEVYIENFGKLNNVHVDMNRGINVFYGKNESGKSTFTEFIHAMIFGMDNERGRSVSTNRYKKMIPWDCPAVFSGWMRIVSEGRIFLIKRNFYKETKEFSCIEELSKKEYTQAQFEELDFIKGINEGVFENIAYIKNMCGGMNGEMVLHLQNYASKTAYLPSGRIDIGSVVDSLEKKKKALKKQTDYSEIERVTRELKENEGVVQEIENNEKNYRALEDQRRTLKESPSIKVNENLKEYVNCSDEIILKYERFRHLTSERRMLLELVGKKEHESKDLCQYGIWMTRIIFAMVFVMAGSISAILFNKEFVKMLTIWALEILAVGVSYFLLSQRLSNVIIKGKIKSYADKEDDLEGLLRNNEKEQKEIHEQICNFVGRLMPVEGIDSMDALMKKFNEEIEDLKKKIYDFSRSYEMQLEQLMLEIGTQKGKLWMLRRQLMECEESAKYLDELNKEKMENDKKIAGYDLAEKILRELSSSMKRTFVEGITSGFSKYVNLLSRGRHQGAIVDETLNIRVLDNGRYVDINSLSTGSIEQIHMALRLSVKEFYGYNGLLMFDDAFVCYDDDRLKEMLKLLNCDKIGQVLIMTCVNREEQMLKEMNVDFEYHKPI